LGYALYPAGGGSGVTVHNNLTGRSTAGAHPASAVTSVPTLPMTADTVQEAIDELAGKTFSRGGTFYSAAGVTTSVIAVWQAPYACRVIAVRGYRVSGTGAIINSRREGSTHLVAGLSLTSADQWFTTGTVQNTDYATGDKMEIEVVSAAGSPTQISVQVDLVRI